MPTEQVCQMSEKTIGSTAVYYISLHSFKQRQKTMFKSYVHYFKVKHHWCNLVLSVLPPTRINTEDTQWFKIQFQINQSDLHCPSFFLRPFFWWHLKLLEFYLGLFLHELHSLCWSPHYCYIINYLSLIGRFCC